MTSVRNFLMAMLSTMMCVALVAKAADTWADDLLLDDQGLSEETDWRVVKPTREILDNVNKCRGSFLRTETRQTKSFQHLIISLTFQPDTHQPTFQLAIQEEQEITEVKVYETLLRTLIATADGGKNTYEYHVVPGEVTYGEETVRSLRLLPVPLQNVAVKVNSQEFTTDAEGVVRDPGFRLNILESLDMLDRRTADFCIEVPGIPEMPATVYTVYRTMPQRSDFDEKLLDEPAQQDLLLAYQLNFRQSLFQPEQEGLEFSLETPPPAVVKTGEFFPITVKIVNHGSKPTSCLLGRTFSRLDGLNGRLFYFGSIEPGNTARFTRYFKVDDDELTSRGFLDFRFSDSWSVLKPHLFVQFPLIHSN